MARLRTLLATGPDGPRDILVIDRLTADDRLRLDARGITGHGDHPPVLVLPFDVELGGEEEQSAMPPGSPFASWTAPSTDLARLQEEVQRVLRRGSGAI